jgi:membrane protein YdbS with pleckstrin-like domain
MKAWTWQKWIGKLLVLAIAIGEAVWVLFEGTPGWWLPIVTGATWLVQFIIALIPAKA